MIVPANTVNAHQSGPFHHHSDYFVTKSDHGTCLSESQKGVGGCVSAQEVVPQEKVGIVPEAPKVTSSRAAGRGVR